MSTLSRLPRVILSLYLIVACLELIGLGLGENGLPLHQITKPLLMPCLIVFVWLERKEIDWSGWILAALGFSWLGDMLLMNVGTIWFILGLGSFLIAHLCYIRRFSLGGNKADSTILKKLPWQEALVLAFGIAVFLFLWPTLGDMRLPVAVYTLVIYAMAVMAFSRARRVSPNSYRFVLAGALLFMVSDSLIALNRFSGPDLTIPRAAIWIMLTYIAAQGLIVWGIRLEKKASD